MGSCAGLSPFLYLCLGPILCVITVFAQAETLLHKKEDSQFCSFFNNRAPEAQSGLKNCTWFKENSCCQQQEIEATFGRVKPLKGASPACQKYINYLMCYICAPNQNIYYQNERLTVCAEFCDSLYSACNSAVLKGSVISELYSSGEQFCISRRFKVSHKNCFTFDISLASTSHALRIGAYSNLTLVIICLSTLLQTGVLAPCISRLWMALSSCEEAINRRAVPGQRTTRDGNMEPTDKSTAHLSSPRLHHITMASTVYIQSMIKTLFIMLTLTHICSGGKQLIHNIRPQDVKLWSQQISKGLNDFADKGLRYQELQKLYDSAKYTTEYINGTHKVLEVRDRLGM